LEGERQFWARERIERSVEDRTDSKEVDWALEKAVVWEKREIILETKNLRREDLGSIKASAMSWIFAASDR
jgi:hypothetical protein